MRQRHIGEAGAERFVASRRYAERSIQELDRDIIIAALIVLVDGVVQRPAWIADMAQSRPQFTF